MHKGLTPAVSLVILTLLVITLASGTAIFLTQNQKQLEDRLRSNAFNDLQVEQAICNGGTIDLTFSNTGPKDYDGDLVEVIVEREGRINTTLSSNSTTTTGSLPAPGNESTITLPVNGVFRSGEVYVLRLDFLDMNYNVKHACRAGLDWWNINYDYRQQIQVTNTGSAKTGAVADVAVNTSGLISEGKMNPGCSDIRVTEGESQVPFSVTGCDTATTTVSFETDVAGSTTEYDTYLYYGNIRAGSDTTALGSADPDLSTALGQEEER